MDYEHITNTVGDLLRGASEDLPSGAMLARLCAAAVDVLGVDGAGVMVTRGGRNFFEQSVSEAARDLEKVQEAMQFGPCLDAASTGEPVVAATAEELKVWPRFAEVAASFGIVGAVALPLMSRGRCWGVLDLYTSRVDAWDEPTLRVAQLLADGATAHLVVTADREAARLAHVQLVHQSTHDDLTGLPNRVYLFDHLQELLDRSAATGELVAVAMVNLQDFGHVNDTFGHRSGDHVLRETAHRLNLVCEPGDVAARMSADVFVLAHVLKHRDTSGDSDELALELADRIQAAVNQPVELEAAIIVPKATVGVATCGGGLSAEEAVDEADNALYDAPDLTSRPVGLRQFHSQLPPPRDILSADLPHALERRALAVHYQPVVSAQPPHRVVGAEALLRWVSPSGQLLPAQNFILAATRHGLMPTFGRWMLEQVCGQVAAWDTQFGGDAVGEVFINVSARELNDPTLLSALSSALDRHQVAPHRIGIEVVEEVMVHRGLVHRINELRDRGHRIAIDDFGTGHSTLSRLTELSIDVVKLDKALTATAARDARRTEFLNAVVALARSVDAQVVAEGVETPAQRDALTQAGADRFQGHLFGRPKPAEHWNTRLRLPAHSYQVHHLLTGRTAIVLIGDIDAILRDWFPNRMPDIDHTIDTLVGNLVTGTSTRRAQNYLGIEIIRSAHDGAERPPPSSNVGTR